jgi:hypothetical protein
MKIKTMRLAGALAAVIALSAGIGVATGAIPSADGKIRACFAKDNGRLRVIDKAGGQKCKSSEKALVWNQRGPSGRQGVAGPPGLAGPAGKDGAPGAPGRSALEPLRSGETIRGVVGGDFDANAAGNDFGVLETFPVPAPQPVNDANVVVDGGDDDEANRCTGTTEAPNAPPGVVCIYPTSVVANATGFRGKDVNVGPSSQFGFELLWAAPAAGDTLLQAIWAYQAP